MKLRTLLEQTNKKSYTEMAKNLWKELTELNKRRHNAIKRIKELKVLEADVFKLLNAYNADSKTEKRDRSNERLNKIHKEVLKIEDFIQAVESQIISAENLFMDIRTNISVGEPEKITTDISSLTGKIKSLEYTVDAIEDAEFTDN
jgi:predicted  nucleic acid-binding Zn-ribbon protein